MGRREAFVYLSAQAGTQAIHAFREDDHTLRNAPYVMPEVLRHDVEMAPRFGSGVSHLLAQGPELAAHIVAKGAQGLVEVSAGLGIHGATLPVRPHPFQVCRVGYSGDHRGLDRPVESAAAAVQDGLEVGEDPLGLLDYQRLAGSGSPSKSDVGSGSGGVTPRSAAKA